MAEEINEALRQHVTRVGFDLSLGKTHIAHLVWLDLLLKANPKGYEKNQFYGRKHRAFAHSATGAHGLMDRGLIQNIAEQRRRPGENLLDMTPRRCFRITPAGRLVINLLKEAGIYQEFAALIPVVPVVREAS